MSGFCSSPIIESLGDRKFRLSSDLTYVSKAGYIYTVPAGFVTDMASSRIGRWQFLDWDLAYGPEPILHDYLYRELVKEGKMKRKDADMLFLEAMKSKSRSFYNKFKAYTAVRMFGWMFV